MTRTRFTITLESVPSDIPATARLKQALKVLLRGFGLRCVTAVETHTENGSPRSTQTTAKGRT